MFLSILLHTVLALLLRPNHLIQGTVGFERGRAFERATDPIPEREVLAIVVVVVHVVVGVMCRAVHDRLEDVGHAEIPVMDRDSPDVDEHIQDQVEQLVHREQEHIDVVGAALRKTIEGVEGMAGKWCGHL